MPTGTPNVYQIDYPIRPGETRIGISYRVPYTSGSFTLSQKILQDIHGLTVFTVDPSMTFMSSSHDFSAQQGVHGMAAYSLDHLSKGETLVLSFSGGEAHPAGIDATTAGNGNVEVIPNQSNQLTIFLMTAMLLVLFGLGIVSVRDASDPLSDATILRGHYDVLVARLARLDDLHAADTISADAYRATREEIMTRLSALAMRLRNKSGTRDQNAARIDSTHQPSAQAAKTTPSP